MAMAIDFKIQGFPVFRRAGNYYIQFSRTNKRSLKTKDANSARTRAEIIVAKYFENKVKS
jgi:hypothetical protein